MFLLEDRMYTIVGSDDISRDLSSEVNLAVEKLLYRCETLSFGGWIV